MCVPYRTVKCTVATLWSRGGKGLVSGANETGGSSAPTRCVLMPIYLANSIIADHVRAMWSSKTPDEAYDMLVLSERVNLRAVKYLNSRGKEWSGGRRF